MSTSSVKVRSLDGLGWGGRRREATVAWSQVGLVQRLLLLGHHAGGWSPVGRPPPQCTEGLFGSAYPVAFHSCLKAVHVLACQAPGYHDLRAIIEVLVTVLQVQAFALRVLCLHACSAVGWPPPHRSPRVQMGALIISGHQRRQGEDSRAGSHWCLCRWLISQAGPVQLPDLHFHLALTVSFSLGDLLGQCAPCPTREWEE